MQSDFLEAYLGVRVSNGFFCKLSCDELYDNSETQLEKFFTIFSGISNTGGKLFVIWNCHLYLDEIWELDNHNHNHNHKEASWLWITNRVIFAN